MTSYDTALVLGLGESGSGAARLLNAEGCAVTAVDAGTTEELVARKPEWEALGISVHLGETCLPDGQYDLCVVSPGVPATSPWVCEASDRGIPILSELELGWSRARGKVLAVTGSNGKSTVTKWCAEAIQRGGRKARIAGNYGHSICDAVCSDPRADVWVLEVSSFQLETTREFRPDVGVLLNILPNHLDRHGSMETYTETKARFFANTGTGDVCVVPYSLLDSMRARSGGEGRWVTFNGCEAGTFRYCNGCITREGRQLADIRGTLFDNDIMGPAAAGVFAALQALDVEDSCVLQSLQRLEALPHRRQCIAEIGRVRFVNDSKATNLAAMTAAVEMENRPVRLIAGGLAKETDFNSVKEVLAQRARSVYLIGKASKEMASAWSDAVPTIECATLENAVRKAWNDACEGETVLLSPGCASFDQYRNYEERGEVFAGMVKDLGEEEAK